MTARKVGTCSACGTPVMFDGEEASCQCGQSTVPRAFIEAARGPTPEERERRFQIQCEAEEMVSRNPRWRESYGDGAIAEAAVVAARAYDARHADEGATHA